MSRRLLLLAVLLPLCAGRAAARPLVAVLAANDGTEVTDFVVPYGVLAQSGVVDVVDVAVESGPVQLMPALTLEPRETLASFDARYPGGADYVVVPAVHNIEQPALIAWLRAQARAGATIVGICDGVWLVGNAGLLEQRAATGHWYSFADLQAKFPGTRWVHDRRYVRDGPVLTTTGVSASLPASLALVEAIAGRARAATLAAELGVSDWSAAHDSARYHLDARQLATAAANLLAVWRWERVGIPIAAGIDEISLSFTADALGRTYRATALTTAVAPGAIITRRGLRLRPDVVAGPGTFDRIEEVPDERVPPGQSLDHALARIAERDGVPTARFVALQLEYPWR